MSSENPWTIEKLTKTNHEKWFRLMKAKVQSKEVMHVLQMSVEEYARVASPNIFEAERDERLEEVTSQIGKLSLHDRDNPSSGNSSYPRVFLNKEKKRKYIRDEGTLIYLLLQGLDDDDQALLDDYLKLL
ncbi:hypothetical protein OnM2_086068, partial [Erysiphe neolycopersici]